MASATNNKGIGIHHLKTGILLFWGIWFAVACLSNLFDFFGAISQLPQSWHFRSGNYALIISVIKIYQFTPVLAIFLFICDIIVQGWAAVLFFVAAARYFKRQKPWMWINLAFGISIALWAVFILLDELFLAYSFEGTHSILMMLVLITFMAIHSLPDKYSSVH